MKTVTLITGGFDPLHSGHIEYINHAKQISDFLVVAINSNDWLIAKKGYYFLPWEERSCVIQNLESVDRVIEFDDSDGTAIDAIRECLKFSDKVIFANGGDRGKDNIPELYPFKNDDRVEFIYSVGGSDKKNSSSWVIDKFIKNYIGNNFSLDLDSMNLIHAPWGNHLSIIDDKGYKLKQLNVNPGGILSLQRHQHRSEHWVIAQGEATVEVDAEKKTYTSGEYVYIPLHSIHRLSNLHDNELLVVIEVQCGEILEESDIERLEDSYGRNSTS
jgi:cytidyltransferase-like protein